VSSVSWQEPGPPDAVRARIIAGIQALGGRVENDTTPEVTARFGSRIRYRLWGLSSAKGRAALPVVMTVRLEEQAEAVAVALTLRSDRGPFVLPLLQSHNAYEARFTDITDKLRV
jgi:hypothetical protein